MKKYKILYCEGNLDGTVGGSYYVLYDLVTNLDKSKYIPIVVFYKDNMVAEKLKEMNIETYIMDRPDPFLIGVNFLKFLQRPVNIIKRFILPALKIARFLKAT